MIGLGQGPSLEYNKKVKKMYGILVIVSSQLQRGKIRKSSMADWLVKLSKSVMQQKKNTFPNN